MPSSPVTKPFPITPVTGYLDTRSTPDEVPFNGYRWVQNMEVTTKHRLCTLPGFEKLLSKSQYNNQDLHDQLFSHTRQPVNLLYQAESTAGFSKLFAGTQNRLYALNSSTGNWKIISDQLGGAETDGCVDQRWAAATVNNTVLFTNGIDDVVYHVIDQPITESGNQSVAVVPDLIALNVRKVSVVIAWNNLMFLMNFEADGSRSANGIMWSDYKRPISFKPHASVSLAGRFFLDSGEAILNALPLGNSLLIYTTRGIWEATATGGEDVIAFVKRYSAPKTGIRCLSYKHTLVSNGSSHFYWNESGIYRYDFYMQHPELTDWIHRASYYIFDDINKAKCNVHHGSFIGKKNTIIWSWAKAGEDCPSMSFRVNTEFPFSAYEDHGYTAFATFEPDTPMNVRDFLLAQCICTVAELNTYSEGFNKEGGFCEPEVETVCGVRPANFFTSVPLVIDNDIEVEDYTQAVADENSLFAMLGNITVQELCDAEFQADECNAETFFIATSAQDYCIKQLTDVHSREICTDFGGCGGYEQLGYIPLWRSGPLDLGIPLDDKMVNLFAIEAIPEDQAVPSQIILRVGMAAQANDPNIPTGTRRVIRWEQQAPKTLEPLSAITEAQHIKNGTRPNENYEWVLYLEGRYFYYELSVVNPNVNPPNTGGACCFSRTDFYAAPKPRCSPS